MSTAAIIARFQTPVLHEGHKALIEEVLQTHGKLVIVLGISPVLGTTKNPFDYHTREKLIKESYPEVVVLPLHDDPSDLVWSQKLDLLLRETFPHETINLFGSRDSFINYYHGKLTTIELPQHGDFNATALRKMYADKVGSSEDFRAGILYASHNQYPKVFPTVDICVFSKSRDQVLLAQKPNNPLWRFPGGFSDPEDSSFEMAAKRELTEECGAIVTGDWHYEASFKIADWRYKNERDKIITSFFSCTLSTGEATPNDDIVHLDWIAIQDLPQLMASDKTSPEHEPLFKHIIEHYTITLK